MFRPRFRLSLLFVLAALVAGVSVWLRQAVVRDRNIRALLAEEWVEGYLVVEANHWNTKVLNFFFQEQRYADRIGTLIIHTDKMKGYEAFEKYSTLGLGESLSTLAFTPSTYDHYPKKMGQNKITLGEIAFWLKKFQTVKSLSVYYHSIVDDTPVLQHELAAVEQFTTLTCIFDATTENTLLRWLKPSPTRIIISNCIIRGEPNDLKDCGLSKDEFEQFIQLNEFRYLQP